MNLHLTYMTVQAWTGICYPVQTIQAKFDTMTCGHHDMLDKYITLITQWLMNGLVD